MMSRIILLLLMVLTAPLTSTLVFGASTPLIIAEKSGYTLPGNSLPGIAAAIAEGTELLRLSAVMTADSKIILLDEAILDQISDVGDRFPDRASDDGSYYPIDFIYEEIQQLSLRQESLQPENDFPETDSAFFLNIPLLSDALSLIKAMSVGNDRHPRIVLELRQNWRYLNAGDDLSFEALSVLTRHGFKDRTAGFIATHDPEELKRIHDEIMPALDMSMKTLQLIETNKGTETMRLERGKWLPYNYDWLFTKFGLKSLSTFADAIGFPPETAITADKKLRLTEYFQDAHLLGLQLLAYPFDQFASPLPDFAATYTDLAAFCLFEAGFDGLLTRKERILRDHLARRQVEIEEETENPKSPIEILLEKAREEQAHHGSDQTNPDFTE